MIWDEHAESARMAAKTLVYCRFSLKPILYLGPSDALNEGTGCSLDYRQPFNTIYTHIYIHIIYIYRELTHIIYIWLWSIYSSLPYRVLSTYQVTFIGFLSCLLNIGVSQKLSRFQQGCNRSTSTLQAYIFMVHTGFMVSKYYSHIYVYIYNIHIIHIYIHTYIVF